jgi:hypothetical protein
VAAAVPAGTLACDLLIAPCAGSAPPSRADERRLVGAGVRPAGTLVSQRKSKQGKTEKENSFLLSFFLAAASKVMLIYC